MKTRDSTATGSDLGDSPSRPQSLERPSPASRAGAATDDEPPTLSGRDRRIAPRFMFQVPVAIRLGEQIGKGQVHDMSSTGARIENASFEPTEGAKVRLGFRLFEKSPQIELYGDVVRKTESGGFCVHFRSVDPRTRRALTTLLPKLGTGRFEQANTRLFTGEIVTKLGPEVHRACVEAAQASGVSLNEWIKSQLQERARQELSDARDGPSSRNPYRR